MRLVKPDKPQPAFVYYTRVMHPDIEKYALDEEIVAYIEKCDALCPAADGKLDVARTRARYLAMCAAFEAPIPDGIEVEDRMLTGRQGVIPVRTYTPADYATNYSVIYYHGGGFVVGNLDSHNSLCAEIADACGCRVTAVDYRLAPEHAHPAAYEDALDAFLALDSGKTVVAGDSAGATLSAAVCITQRKQQQAPAGQVLIYPWLGGDLHDLESYHTNSDAPGLTTQDLQDYCALRCRGEAPRDDPTFYPLAQQDFSGVAPCIALAAEHDPLFDDAGYYVDRLGEAGVDASLHIDHGLIHGHLRARHTSPKVARSFSRVCSAIRQLGGA